jgi:Pvc16 N-terminal domain
VIDEIDESLRRLVLRDAVNGSGVELSFEAPTKEWASRRNTPTINIYLYDIREDVQLREVEYEEIRDADGRVTERRPPPRRYRLSYLVTVWTQRPEDEHRVLSSLLACFLKYERLPDDVLVEALAAQPYSIRTTVALPASQDRALADLWSALGGELKPSLDLVVTAPFDAGRVLAAGPPVLVPPEIVVRDITDADLHETVGGERQVPAGAS